MIEIEKTDYLGNLFELYGRPLSASQESVFRDYYENDLTLSEIAENNNVSRQAVYDCVLKAQKKLIEIEDKVGAYKEICRLKGKLNGNIQ